MQSASVQAREQNRDPCVYAPGKLTKTHFTEAGQLRRLFHDVAVHFGPACVVLSFSMIAMRYALGL